MEHIRTPKVDGVRLLDRFNTRKPIIGTLYLTATHIIFVDPEGKKETWVSHMHVGSVERLAAIGSGWPLQVHGKNFLNVTFVIPKERECQDIYASLQHLSQPGNLEDLYAFHYTALDISQRHVGWDFFDLQSEYLRMGVPNDHWVLSHINKDYELCDTYPRYLYVPSAVPTPVVLGSARFRSRGRLPVLSYLHRENQAAICRCSQPLAGFSARCVEDESLLQSLRKANPSSKYMFVVDTRPKINAMANRATGKGYENETFYSNIKFQFWGIENIHVMRASLQKLVEVCELSNPSMSAFLNGLESCGWIKHIKAIIDASVFIAKAIHEGVSVLVHCSDGWDRTAQTCSLASLMLDPYYRTIEGFQTLLEKEWLAFGHKFTERCGFLGTVDQKETSPVFTQFIDSVWQLTQQFPTAFQFNERYLLSLHDHIYSCQFGTFIGNCEKDRVDLRLRERTYSLWGYMSKYVTDFTNPFYTKSLEISQPIVIPVTNPQSFKFWRAMYCRFENGIHPRDNIVDVVCMLKDHIESLQDHKQHLEKRVVGLNNLLGYSYSEEALTKALQNLSSSESLDFRAYLLPESAPSSAPSYDGSFVSAEASDVPGNSPAKSPSSKQNGNDEDNPAVVSADQLLAELQSVAIEWKTFRRATNCSCAIPFEQHSKKHHCWSCGGVYCTRCIDRYIAVPGHDSGRPVPVCKVCYKHLRSSPCSSVEELDRCSDQA